MRQHLYQHGEFPRIAAEASAGSPARHPASTTCNEAHPAPAARDAAAANDRFARIELPLATMSALQLMAAARHDRAVRIAALGAVALRLVRACVRRVAARVRRAWEVHATVRVLRSLNSRTLHDLGFHRSEILSVALAVASDTSSRRVRAARSDSPSALTD